MPGRNGQVTRIYSILNVLEGAPHGLTVGDIENRLKDLGHEASRRTIYRDLEALNAAGFPLFPHGQSEDTNATRWVLERMTSVNNHLVLSVKELVALFLAKGVLTPLQGTPFYQDLEKVFNKIEEKLGTNARDYLKELGGEMHFEPTPKWGLGLNPDVIETVRACCSERQVLEVTYSSVNSGKRNTRRLGPHFLYFAKASLYLVAEDLDDSKIKVFSCPRMSDAKMLDEPYTKTPINPEGILQGRLRRVPNERSGHACENRIFALKSPLSSENANGIPRSELSQRLMDLLLCRLRPV